jgi:methyl-accepting chemotaxis protein
MASETNKQIEQILIEIQAYVEQLNKSLKTSTEEVNQTKEEIDEVITLAGELDACLKTK